MLVIENTDHFFKGGGAHETFNMHEKDFVKKSSWVERKIWANLKQICISLHPLLVGYENTQFKYKMI